MIMIDSFGNSRQPLQRLSRTAFERDYSAHKALASHLAGEAVQDAIASQLAYSNSLAAKELDRITQLAKPSPLAQPKLKSYV